MRNSLPLSITTLAATLALASPALASDRYAEPGGNGFGGCLIADPCSLATAVAQAANGDHIKLLAGTHTVANDIDILVPNLTIEPAVPGERPVVSSTSDVEPVFSNQPVGAGTTVMRGLKIVSASEQTDSDHEALVSSRPLLLADTLLSGRGRVLRTFNLQATTIEDVEVTQVAGVQPAVQILSGSTTLRRAIVTAATGSEGLQVSGAGTQVLDTVVSGGDEGLTLSVGATARRVTASGVDTGIESKLGTTLTDSVARATGGGTGLRTSGGGLVRLRNVTAVGTVGMNVTGAGTTTEARNVIARGSVVADVQVVFGGALTLDHSNVGTVAGPYTDGGGNQTADPRFVDAAGGDLRVQAGSPVVDAGVADDVIGATDRSGASRFQGAAPDIGAFETAPGAEPGAPGPGPGAGTPPEPGNPSAGAVDKLAPVASALKASAVRTKSARLTFSLNEGAATQLVLRKVTGGRRQSGRCVKATQALRGAKRCLRQVTLVTTRKTLSKGAVVVRIGARLTAGTYRVTVTPTDRSGNRGKAVGRTFTVKRSAR